MTIEELKKKVQSLIGDAKTKDAMDTVATWAYENNEEQIKNDISLLKGDWNDLNREIMLGQLSNSEGALRKNKLNYSVLNMLSTLSATIPPAETTMNNSHLAAPKKRPDLPLSVFISYSKNDKTYLDSFKAYVKPLERNGSIKIWDDTKLIAGEVWEQAIENQLNTADIIIFLVSADLINTDYVWDKEMTAAFARHEQGTVVVVPVILRDCGWQDTGFAKFNALPDKGRPVSSFKTQDDAWLLVYEKLKELIA